MKLLMIIFESFVAWFLGGLFVGGKNAAKPVEADKSKKNNVGETDSVLGKRVFVLFLFFVMVLE